MIWVQFFPCQDLHSEVGASFAVVRWNLERAISVNEPSRRVEMISLCLSWWSAASWCLKKPKQFYYFVFDLFSGDNLFLGCLFVYFFEWLKFLYLFMKFLPANFRLVFLWFVFISSMTYTKLQTVFYVCKFIYKCMSSVIGFECMFHHFKQRL